jgi:nitrite reductase/ring-hydroxylating ferredoxin subunit
MTATAMADGWIAVCSSDALAEGGDGVRFELPPTGPARSADRPLQAFVIRYDGRPHAWLNRCAHVPVELDWLPGRFFDDAGLLLVCATHGAAYEPDSGLCVAGPCRGASLVPVPVIERDGMILAEAGACTRGDAAGKR